MTLADLLTETYWHAMDVCEALEGEYWDRCDAAGVPATWGTWKTLVAFSNVRLLKAEQRAAIVAYE